MTNQVAQVRTKGSNYFSDGKLEIEYMVKVDKKQVCSATTAWLRGSVSNCQSTVSFPFAVSTFAGLHYMMRALQTFKPQR
jgi:hypothetical protein